MCGERQISSLRGTQNEESIYQPAGEGNSLLVLHGKQGRADGHLS